MRRYEQAIIIYPSDWIFAPEPINVLSDEELQVLTEAAKKNRELSLTKDEKDAIVYAVRMIRMQDVLKAKDPEMAIQLVATLAGVVKKLGG